jgi:hypothetical protein
MRQEQLPDVAQCDLCDEDGWVTGDLDEDRKAETAKYHSENRDSENARRSAYDNTRRAVDPQWDRLHSGAYRDRQPGVWPG